ncbi:pyridoxal phosphate-dependent aminotransferase family protein [Aurantibacter sp.]|uniref:aminotransferase class I/II-fold pyridoxal phosphate-dependent enzyme n=1 Tax=Aurantibacter sp. TaxID=2807103 RepID=UPI003264FA9F
MLDLPKKLQLKLERRVDEKSFRKLPVEKNLIDFASNDYLGLARESDFEQSSQQFLLDVNFSKNGATGSRLLTGNHSLYEKLELSLVEFFGSESALVFNSGYDANIGFFSCVPQRGDIVFYDEFIHASIRDGVNLGNAKSFKFKHNNLEDLKLKYLKISDKTNLNEQVKPEIYVVTEAVFSMDGDSPDLKTFTEFCKKNELRLVIDEAHSVGVFGEKGDGLVSKFGIENQVFARIVTFGKAFGCHGAAVIGSNNLVEYLVNFARSFIYTTALPPYAIANIIAVLEFLNSVNGDIRRNHLHEKISFFKSEIKKMNLSGLFTQSNSTIHCALISGNENVKILAQNLQEKGFNVKPILSPTVAMGKERLRFCVHSYNSKEEITECLSILSKFR